MQARGDPVTYEVRLEVDESIVAEVDAWLREHVVEMLRLPGFSSAEILDDAPLPVPADDKVRRTVHYQVANRDALTSYLLEHAPRMREAGAKRFGDRMRATRRVLQPITTPARAPDEPARTIAALPAETGSFATHIEVPTEAVRACSNCHALLNGQYCAICGQRDRSRMISLWELIADFAGEFANFDSRFWRTLLPLLFRPGRLTSEYLRGRRVHFTPPLRMYVISSVLFFLLANLGGIENGMQFDDDEEPEAPATQSDGSHAPPSQSVDPQAIESEAPAPPADGAEPTAAQEAELERLAEETAKGRESESGIVIGNERCTLGEFQTGNAYIDGPVRARLQDACDRIAADHGRNFLRELVSNIPKMLFILLPAIALAMKPLYFGSHRYYVEHLLFFVHVHSFIFVVLSITLMTSALKEPFPSLTLVHGLLVAAVSIYIPYYLFRALRVVYGQGRFVTLIKYVSLFFIYVIGFSIIFALGAVITALTV